MSKGYTIQFFINEISTKVNRGNDVNAFIKAISPVYGINSVKIGALDNFIGDLNKVANGRGRYAGFGKTPKARVLKALKLRKKLGFSS
jgi:hypothetical protein